MNDIPSVAMPYYELIEQASLEHEVPMQVIGRTIMAESAGDPNAWNGSNNENSRGLMQISERTALGDPLNIPVMELERLFEPEYNINIGTFYLRYIYDFLEPYFLDSMTEKDKWYITSNSYNQGHGYYKNALISMDENEVVYQWSTMFEQVMNPVNGGRTPWRQNALEYAEKIVGPLDDDWFTAYEPWSFSDLWSSDADEEFDYETTEYWEDDYYSTDPNWEYTPVGRSLSFLEQYNISGSQVAIGGVGLVLAIAAGLILRKKA